MKLKIADHKIGECFHCGAPLIAADVLHHDDRSVEWECDRCEGMNHVEVQIEIRCYPGARGPCTCGMGDASLPELHDHYCGVFG